jgi:catechol 2,3-dioxygenase-like lactoylglutathione lyase family enzyme
VAFIFNVAFDCADPPRLARFWADVTGYAVEHERPDFVRLRAPDSRSVRHLLFFRVPEPKTVKNRMHLDLADRDPEGEVRRLVGLGATELEKRSGNGARWTVMLDPEGNEFCLG